MKMSSNKSSLIVGGLVILLGILMAVNIPGISLVLSYWPILLVVMGLGMVVIGQRNPALGLILAVVGLQVLSLRLNWPAGSGGNTFRGVLFIIIGLLVIVMFAKPSRSDGTSK